MYEIFRIQIQLALDQNIFVSTVKYTTLEGLVNISP